MILKNTRPTSFSCLLSFTDDPKVVVANLTVSATEQNHNRIMFHHVVSVCLRSNQVIHLWTPCCSAKCRLSTSSRTWSSIYPRGFTTPTTAGSRTSTCWRRGSGTSQSNVTTRHFSYQPFSLIILTSACSTVSCIFIFFNKRMLKHEISFRCLRLFLCACFRKMPEKLRTRCGFFGDHGFDNKITSMRVRSSF